MKALFITNMARYSYSEPLGLMYLCAACKALRDAGIKFQTNNLVGIPQETVGTVLETLDLNLEIKPIHVSAYIFQPFPRTELCEMAKEQGIYDGNQEGVGAYDRFSDSWQIPDKKILLRLRALIGPVAFMPFLRPITPLLMRLPLGAVYGVMSKLVVGYCTKFRLFPTKIGIKRFTKLLMSYFFKNDPF